MHNGIAYKVTVRQKVENFSLSIIYFLSLSHLCHLGRLGLSLPSGRSTAIIFDEDHRTLSLYYRTMIRGETFRACNRDGDLLAGNFSVSMPSQLRECQLGREGGFSMPFRITVTYLGSEPFVGLVIVTSSSCEDPYSTNSFIELGKWCTCASIRRCTYLAVQLCEQEYAIQKVAMLKNMWLWHFF